MTTRGPAEANPPETLAVWLFDAVEARADGRTLPPPPRGVSEEEAHAELDRQARMIGDAVKPAVQRMVGTIGEAVRPAVWRILNEAIGPVVGPAVHRIRETPQYKAYARRQTSRRRAPRPRRTPREQRPARRVARTGGKDPPDPDDPEPAGGRLFADDLAAARREWRPCHYCGERVPMPGWLACRRCWADRYRTGPGELPDEHDEIAMRFASPPDWLGAA
jgi:hypothetical protein